MRVLFVVAEFHPFVKTGGLGDVAEALPQALRAQGVDVRVLLPGYPAVVASVRKFHSTLPDLALPGGHKGRLRLGDAGIDLPLYVLDAPALFDRPGGPYADSARVEWPDNHVRFAALCYAAALISTGGDHGWSPDVVHCHDWHTGLTAAYLRHLGALRAVSILTIHNLAHQGVFGAETFASLGLPPAYFDVDGLEYYGSVGFLKAGLYFADRLTAVSPTYAREIQDFPEGRGLEGLLRTRSPDLTGILNGIDTGIWNPATDPNLSACYDVHQLGRKAENKARLQREFGLATQSDLPLVAVISRLVPQKGLDLVLATISAREMTGLQLVLLGTGDAELEAGFRAAALREPHRIGVRIGYDEALAHRILGGADLILVPSRSEPCGLTPLYGLRYGTLPVVHGIGGLRDTVIDASDHDAGTGFVFASASSDDLAAAIARAVAVLHQPQAWRRLQCRAMAQNFSWANSARQYIRVYEVAAAEKASLTPRLV
jgi:starch synthase